MTDSVEPSGRDRLAVRLGELLRQALEECSPDALVGARVRLDEPLIVDGYFDLADAATRFVEASRAAKLI